jgi:hypothetical protein
LLLAGAALTATLAASHAWATLEISILEGSPATISWSADWDATSAIVSNSDPENLSVEHLTAPSGTSWQATTEMILLWENSASGQILSDVVRLEWGGANANAYLFSVEAYNILLADIIPTLDPGLVPILVQEKAGVMTFGDGIPFNVNIQSEPVPEPTTMIAGALLLLPFGASMLRMLRKSRMA